MPAAVKVQQRRAQCAHVSWQPGQPCAGATARRMLFEHHVLQPRKLHELMIKKARSLAVCELDACEALQRGDARQHFRICKLPSPGTPSSTSWAV